MGILAKVEDRPTPKEVYNYRVYLSAALASFAAVMIGYDSAFIGGTIALTSFRTEFGLDKLSTTDVAFLSANIVSTYQAGCFFGAIGGYPVSTLMGRKLGIFLASAIFLVGAVIQCVAKGSIGFGPIYAGRVIAGFGIGMASNIVPAYVTEIAPPAIRGRLVGFYEMGWQIGGLVGFWINYGVSTTMEISHIQWLIPFIVQIIPGAIMLIGSFWLRESPRWLLNRGRSEEAIRNLCWIRNLGEGERYVQEELAMMEAQKESQRQSIGLDFWAPFRCIWRNSHIRNRLLLGASLFAWQNGTGINAINYYSPTVFKSIGLTGTNTGLFSTGIFGVIKTTVTIIWILYLIDIVGRRRLLLIGSFGGAICMYAVGAYIAIANPSKNPSATVPPGGIAAMFFFYMWTVFYTPTWNGGPWVINAEIFDQGLRGLTQAVCASSNWFFNFIIARFTPQMFNSMGFGVYMFFASLMILSIPYVYFLIPETKSVPLEDMDYLFGKGMRPWNAHEKVMRRVRERAEEREMNERQRTPDDMHKMKGDVRELERKGTSSPADSV
ncbi:hypothetical protein G7K_1478-t1 [Saitoella complicata NRRL Y-17804]|uniref:Quinate transporter n=2 Tax=Saitoella complicata (strain BCRC 22490 / CBS 7301 / JCM 7358 / NBRC 10748 / NRRL Y-17804) TaxID=698492 RepID=A0A0E9NBT5_SAICN|nr:hypothetical protein G7K_1478-t1 [Saitoella complicata NRRL Y-17804]